MLSPKMREGEVNYRKSRENESKRIKVSHEDIKDVDFSVKVVTPLEEPPGLLSLSDDVLLQIFSKLTPIDVMSLGLTCLRLSDLVKDRTLWEVVDFEDFVCYPELLDKIIPYLQPVTKSIFTKGPASSEVQNPTTITKSFLHEVAEKAPNLKELVLDGHILDTTQLELQDFPRSLQALGLRKCIFHKVSSDKSYFLKIWESLPYLKRLDLTDSEWFNPHSLLALSKCQTLKELILTGCDVSECLPYASLAANFGFSALEVLDLRFTRVSDTEVSCFNRTLTLKKLFLEADSPEPQDPLHRSVTDDTIKKFGGPRKANENLFPQGHLGDADGLLILELDTYPRPDCYLESLVVRGYSRITDLSLRHAAQYMQCLKFLDVTNSGCTRSGVIEFRKRRPEVKLVCGHLEGIEY